MSYDNSWPTKEMKELEILRKQAVGLNKAFLLYTCIDRHTGIQNSNHPYYCKDCWAVVKERKALSLHKNHRDDCQWVAVRKLAGEKQGGKE